MHLDGTLGTSRTNGCATEANLSRYEGQIMNEQTTKPIRLGVIGCGYWGPNLVRNFVDLPGAEVVAVADIREKRRDYMRAIYPSLMLTESYQEMLEMELDAAVIATPAASHYSIARDCIEHDLAVLVEKPMALSSTDAEKLIALAYDRGLVLMAGHTCEYNPAIRVLKDMIRKGELGKILHINSVRTNLGLFQQDLDVVWDLAPHDLSILFYLLDTEPTSIGASGGSHVLDGLNEMAYLNLRFPEGITAHVHVSWLDPRKARRMTIVGSRKMAMYDELAPTQQIRIYDKGIEFPEQTNDQEEFKPSYRFGNVDFPKIPHAEPLRLECEDFLRAVATGANPQSDGEAGLRVIRALEAATTSLMNGGGHEGVLFQEHFMDKPASVV